MSAILDPAALGLPVRPLTKSPISNPRIPRLAEAADLRTLRVAMLLLAVAILNTVDLLYTLFADRIGMLNELNPIAATFLQADLRPSLICYKLLMVLCGLGLIWKLRRSRLAIPACWILVVVYTGLSITWYYWVRDVTTILEVHLSVAAPK